MRSTVGVSTLATDWSRLMAILRLGDFFSRMCDFMPCRRISLPVPVILKRFLAPEWVFCLGMLGSGWSGRGLGLRLRLDLGLGIALGLGAGGFGCLSFGCLWRNGRLGRGRLGAARAAPAR